MAVSLTGRLHGWADMARLTCPVGHRMKHDAVLFTDGVLRCRHKIGQGECGLHLYVVACQTPRSPDPDPRYCYVAEVTWEEVKALKALNLGTMDVLARLGLATPSLSPVGAAP